MLNWLLCAARLRDGGRDFLKNLLYNNRSLDYAWDDKEIYKIVILSEMITKYALYKNLLWFKKIKIGVNRLILSICLSKASSIYFVTQNFICCDLAQLDMFRYAKRKKEKRCIA